MPWTPEDWEGLLESEPQATHRTAANQALEEILQRIPGRAHLTVADLGCADGERLPLLGAHFGRVLAVTRTATGVAAVRRAGREHNVECTVCDLAGLSALTGSIDVALALNVEAVLHDVPLDRFIQQVHDVLVEGGILLMSVPAAKRMGGPVELRLGKVSQPDVRRSFHEVELQYRVHRAGFLGLRIRRFAASDDRLGTLLCMAVRRASN